MRAQVAASGWQGRVEIRNRPAMGAVPPFPGARFLPRDRPEFGFVNRAITTDVEAGPSAVADVRHTASYSVPVAGGGDGHAQAMIPRTTFASSLPESVRL